jgi:hypothetical protein
LTGSVGSAADDGGARLTAAGGDGTLDRELGWQR